MDIELSDPCDLLSQQNNCNVDSSLIHLFNILSGLKYDFSQTKRIPPKKSVLKLRLCTVDSDLNDYVKNIDISTFLAILKDALISNNDITQCNVLAALSVWLPIVLNDVSIMGHKEMECAIYISNCIYSEDSAIQFWACLALINFTRHDNCKEIVGNIGVGRLLEIAYMGSPESRTSALNCLITLSVHPIYKSVFVNRMENLMNNLTNEDDNIVADSLWILSNLSSLKEAQIKFLSLGGVELLFYLLESKDDHVIERTMNAIQNFSFNDSVETSIVEKGGIPILLSFLGRNAPSIIYATCGALNNLTWKEEHKNIFVRCSGIHSVINLLSKTDSRTLVYVTGILWNVSYKNVDDIMEIIRHGGIDLLLSHISECNHQDILVNVLGTIQNLSCIPCAKITLIQKGLIGILVNALKNSNDFFLCRIERILLNILGSKKACDLSIKEGFIIPLLKFIRNQPCNEIAKNILSKVRSHNSTDEFASSHKKGGEGHFNTLVNNEMFSDLKIWVDNQVIHAHKSILFSRVTYWKNLFSSGMKDSNLDEIKIKYFHDYDAFLKFIGFVYSNDDGCITPSNVFELLRLADYYGVQSLTNSCEKFLYENVAMYSVKDILGITKHFNLTKLKVALRKLILFKFDSNDLTDEILEVM